MIAVEHIQPEEPDATVIHALDGLLAVATSTWGPIEVIAMLRHKADLIEAISKRRLH